VINGEVGAQHEVNLRHLAMNSTRAANRGLPQRPRFARVTAAVPANLPLGGASSSNITALSTTIEVLKAGTGWQAAPAAGARTTSNNRARNANTDDVSTGDHFVGAGPTRFARLNGRLRRSAPLTAWATLCPTGAISGGETRHPGARCEGAALALPGLTIEAASHHRPETPRSALHPSTTPGRRRAQSSSRARSGDEGAHP
jgi:hypothetical protein